MYHPVPIEQKCPALARVLDEISAGKFGEGSVYDPCVSRHIMISVLEVATLAVKTDLGSLLCFGQAVEHYQAA